MIHGKLEVYIPTWNLFIKVMERKHIIDTSLMQTRDRRRESISFQIYYVNYSKTITPFEFTDFFYLSSSFKEAMLISKANLPSIISLK